MSEMEKKRNRLLAEQVIKGLQSRNMEGYFADTGEEALKRALELIPGGSSVGWGGCKSAEQIGLLQAVKEGNYTALDRSAGKNPEEVEEITRSMFSADFFISSVNAMTEDGILVNVDGNANRVAAICYGPKNVLMIVGMNKVCQCEEDAMGRARNLAAPVNAQRFDLSTPCVKTGRCADCKSQDTICCQFLTTRFSRAKGRIKVILVNEDLGF